MPENIKDAEKGEAFQQGIASWYGPKFHGQVTANGELYDMEAMTAAHRSLPFNSKVRVVNLRNGRSVVVRINDRGPFVDGRIIDLSKKAARKLNMLGPGTAPVHLYLLSKGNQEGQPGTPSTTPNYTIQLGAYKKRSNALDKSDKIKDAYIDKVRVDGMTIYRVYYGRYDHWEKATKRLQQFKQNGYNAFIKQLDGNG